MPKLIPLHFVWFVNEPVIESEENKLVPYIDSIIFEKVYVDAEHISAIKYFYDYAIPLLDKGVNNDCGFESCIVDDYQDFDDMKLKRKSSLVFFSDCYADRLRDYILDYDANSYHRITKNELDSGDFISFVIYESPEEIMHLLKV